MPAQKILYIVGSLDLGGTEKHVSLIAPLLKKAGWDLEIYCLTHRGILADQVTKAGVNVIGPPSEIDKTQTALGKLVRLAASSAKLTFRIFSKRPNIVHFFLPAAYLIGGPIAVVARVPIRVMSRRSLNQYQITHKTLARIERLLHPRMHMLLANSQAVLNELREEAPASVASELIHNGTQVTDINPPSGGGTASLSQNGRSGTLTLIIIANLIPYKGHADLFRALAGIKNSLPAPWTLLCVGRDDGIGDNLLHLARDLAIDSNVQFLGARTDIPTLLAAADIGILSSHEEGFSNAVLEGMMAGLPMVVTDVGGNAEAVENGKTGFVVPAHDPTSLGAAIASLASNTGLRDQMGAAARFHAVRDFSLERCVENYDILYRKLAQK